VRDEKDVVIILIILIVNEAGIGRDRAILTTRARFRPWLQGSTTPSSLTLTQAWLL
jgi:hypothetical protein